VVIRLERNYRSGGHILAVAAGLIAHNQGRLGKTLFTDAPAGDKPIVTGVWDSQEEARVVGDALEAAQRQGLSLDDAAILVRTSAQMREFEERFIAMGLPYKVIGGPRFYERAEIRDALAYLRCVAQPDDDLAFERIYNQPRRGLGEATLAILHEFGRRAGVSLMRAAAMLIETEPDRRRRSGTPRHRDARPLRRPDPRGPGGDPRPGPGADRQPRDRGRGARGVL
jgi:DNA helicase II / ATP-dependent DNA helicase PcrA